MISLDQLATLRHVVTALDVYPRIALCGGPQVGKTTLAKQFDRPRIHSDDTKPYGWDQVPYEIIARCQQAGPKFVCEGVQVVRALRKGLEVDCAVWIDGPKVVRLKGQEAMAKGNLTIWLDWRAHCARPPILFKLFGDRLTRML